MLKIFFFSKMYSFYWYFFLIVWSRLWWWFSIGKCYRKSGWKWEIRNFQSRFTYNGHKNQKKSKTNSPHFNCKPFNPSPVRFFCFCFTLSMDSWDLNDLNTEKGACSTTTTWFRCCCGTGVAWACCVCSRSWLGVVVAAEVNFWAFKGNDAVLK